MPTPSGCSVASSVYGSRWGAPIRHEPNTRRACRSPARVTIREGGRSSSGGHTFRPSSVTSYSVLESGDRPSISTSA